MEKKINSDTLNILRKINQSPKTSQRKLAKDLNLSLGKLNYLLKALRAKGLVKIKNFSEQEDKLKYIQYVITPKGVSFRTKLTINFMKKKLREYEELKRELNN